ncbi:hypothetical protein GCM10009645_17060 [Mycolicibacterium poriferae]|uniref:Uncharacterized protein n=1 Tax=Mycolicibacterium poriferae TaxID=39694 RepID=A0A6N4V6K4_9MYCO|nr:hypothetical protein MPOR_15610 [Mycolicibacterium poriferae]
MPDPSHSGWLIGTLTLSATRDASGRGDAIGVVVRGLGSSVDPGAHCVVAVDLLPVGAEPASARFSPALRVSAIVTATAATQAITAPATMGSVFLEWGEVWQVPVIPLPPGAKRPGTADRSPIVG